jgi:hypothetical protein
MIKKIVLAIFIVGFLGGGGYAAWMYFKPHQNILKAKPTQTLTAEQIIDQFSAAAEAENNAWVGEIIQINGKITKLNEQNNVIVVSMDYGKNYIVQAYLKEGVYEVSKLKVGDEITLKGKFVGVMIIDEDFFIPGDIKLEQCYIIQ